MYKNRANNFFEENIINPSSEFQEELDDNLDDFEFEKQIKEIFEEQLRHPFTSFRVDIVNQINTTKSSSKLELMEYVFNYIVNNYDVEIDVHEVKSSYENLHKYTRLLYDAVYYNSFDLLSNLVSDVLIENKKFLESIFTGINSYDLDAKTKVNSIKKSYSDVENKHLYMVYGVVDKIFENEETFKLIFNNEELYSRYSDSDTTTLEYLLYMQSSEVIFKLFEKYFNDSFQKEMFLQKIKHSILMEVQVKVEVEDDENVSE